MDARLFFWNGGWNWHENNWGLVTNGAQQSWVSSGNWWLYYVVLVFTSSLGHHQSMIVSPHGLSDCREVSWGQSTWILSGNQAWISRIWESSFADDSIRTCIFMSFPSWCSCLLDGFQTLKNRKHIFLKAKWVKIVEQKKQAEVPLVGFCRRSRPPRRWGRLWRPKVEGHRHPRRSSARNVWRAGFLEIFGWLFWLL